MSDHAPLNVRCSCIAGAACKSIGKHPRFHEEDLQHGCKDATTDEQQIRIWWSRWPDANIGIATGERSVIVLDVDPRHHGDATLKDWLMCTQCALTDHRRTSGGSDGA